MSNLVKKKPECVNIYESSKKHQLVVSNEKVYINNETGEVKTTEYHTVKKAANRAGFLKLFSQNIASLTQLSKDAMVLFFMLLQDMGYNNLIKIDRDFRNRLFDNKTLGKNSYYKALKELTQNNIIIKADNEFVKNFNQGVGGFDYYVFNPNYVGKGSFIELKELNQTIELKYDFEKLEVEETRTFEGKYDSVEGELKSGEAEPIEAQNNKEIIEATIEATNDSEIIDIEVEPNREPKEPNKSESTEPKEQTNQELATIKRAKTKLISGDIKRAKFVGKCYAKHGRELKELDKKISSYFYRNKIEILEDISNIIFNCGFAYISQENRLKTLYILDSFDVNATGIDNYLIQPLQRNSNNSAETKTWTYTQKRRYSFNEMFEKMQEIKNIEKFLTYKKEIYDNV